MQIWFLKRSSRLLLLLYTVYPSRVQGLLVLPILTVKDVFMWHMKAWSKDSLMKANKDPTPPWKQALRLNIPTLQQPRKTQPVKCLISYNHQYEHSVHATLFFVYIRFCLCFLYHCVNPTIMRYVLEHCEHLLSGYIPFYFVSLRVRFHPQCSCWISIKVGCYSTETLNTDWLLRGLFFILLRWLNLSTCFWELLMGVTLICWHVYTS